MSLCKGFNYSLSGSVPKTVPCTNQSDTKFCERHVYMEKFTEDEMKDIGENKIKGCKSHYNFKTENNPCFKCKASQVKNNVKAQEKKKEKQKDIICTGYVGNYEMIEEKKVVVSHRCKRKKEDNEQFCEWHLYQKFFTKDEFNKIAKDGVCDFEICNTHFRFITSDKPCEACINYKKSANCKKSTEKTNEQRRQATIEKRNTKKVCIGFTMKNKPCTYFASDNELFCASFHKYLFGVKEDEINKLSHCTNEKCNRYDMCKDGLCHDCVPKPIKRCKGYVITSITKSISKCTRPTPDTEYCVLHHYFEEFTQEELQTIINSKSAICRRHLKFIPNDKECGVCIAHETKKEEYKKTEEYANTLCQWRTQDGKKCIYVNQKDNLYCKRHDYASEYTEDQIKECQHCASCRRYVWWNDIITEGPRKGEKYKLCPDCRNRGVENRDIIKEENEKKDKCLYNECKFLAKKEGYCMKHHQWYTMEKYKKELLQEGKSKLCTNYIRGCRNIFDIDSDYSSCERCRQIANMNDTDLRNTRINNNNNRTDDLRTCISCGKDKTKDMFKNEVNNYRHVCHDCYENKKFYDSGRVSRSHRLSNLDKIREIRRRIKTHEIKLTDDQILTLIDKPCVYCGSQDKIMNGIDRVDNNKGYIQNNCVPCCEKCNMMKYQLDVFDFLKYCMNIEENYECIEPVTEQHIYRYYSAYKADAIRRGKIFELTPADFKELMSYKCVYCASLNDMRIGIDRVDNDIGYVKGNVVSCCTVCNFMKRDYSLYDFLFHIHKINTYQSKPDNKFDISMAHIPVKGKITKKMVIDKINVWKDKCNRENKDETEHSDMNDTNFVNFGKIKFMHSNKYYLNKIYNPNLEVIKYFIPEIEFCETKEQRDIWNWFRLKVSPCPLTKIIGDQIYILVRDKITKKYVGITSLSSDTMRCSDRDNELKWTNNMKKTKIVNIANISTCVSIPPFSHNFNGGKLLTMLMFSKEVNDYYRKKCSTYSHNKKLACIVTLSLYGKSVQYDRLKEVKLIGYTKGYGSMHIPQSLYDYCVRYMDQEKIDHKKWNRKMYKMSALCKLLQIPDITEHKQCRGIYLGYTGTNAQAFLQGKVDDFEQDKLKSVEDIGKFWLNRWAIQRYENLVKTGRVQLSNPLETNIITQADKDRIRQREYRAKKNNPSNLCFISDDNEKELIKKHMIWLSKRYDMDLNTNYLIFKHRYENQTSSLTDFRTFINDKYQIFLSITHISLLLKYK